MRIYAIGDVHGCLPLLEDLQARILADSRSARDMHIIQIFLGDYVDRGVDSRGVLDALLALPPPGWRRICLRGNHEQMLLGFLEDPGSLEFWRNNGGLETLASYGVDVSRTRDPSEGPAVAEEFAAKLPESHLRLLRSLPVSTEIGQYFFVHAGVRPGVPLDRQDQDEMLWIREPFLWSDADFGKIVVHGHTPVEQPEIRHNRINIDTGAYLTGRLTCAVLEGDDIRFL